MARPRPNRTRILAWFVALALGLGPVPPGARADTASQRLAEYEKPVDEAIDQALTWLARRQLESGGFANKSRRGRKDKADSTAVTSLCVMAFLAKGYTPGRGPHGQLLNDAIDYVLDQQNRHGVLNDGPSNGEMYHHGISTLMLSEVSGMVDPARQERVGQALAKALKVILAAQRVRKDRKHRGGWRYKHSSRDSDISVTGWQILSLRSARGNGAKIPGEAIEQGLAYVLRCRRGDGGFAYQPGGRPGIARTGTALLCLELLGRHDDAVTRKAGAWILRHRRDLKPGKRHYAYGLYYTAQGMFQLGGKAWEQFAEHLYRICLKTQEKDGSWDVDRHGDVYSTAMNVLALSVSYRQLPIYQR
jgi:prenyltransferase beta subunit